MQQQRVMLLEVDTVHYTEWAALRRHQDRQLLLLHTKLGVFFLLLVVLYIKISLHLSCISKYGAVSPIATLISE